MLNIYFSFYNYHCYFFPFIIPFILLLLLLKGKEAKDNSNNNSRHASLSVFQLLQLSTFSEIKLNLHQECNQSKRSYHFILLPSVLIYFFFQKA
jgi:hypothetical protein